MVSASERYTVTLEELHAGEPRLKRLVRFAGELVLDMVTDDRSIHPLSRYVVKVTDRVTNSAVITHRHGHGHDLDGAERNRLFIESNLDRMSVEQFEQEFLPPRS
jgi:hypothetical protein